MAKLINYVPTESEMRQIVGKSWPDKLIKDYIASKVNESSINGEVEDATTEIVTIKGDIITINGQIATLTTRITTAEGNITTLTTNLAAHVGATSAHGASGNIVGTNNYCSPTVGGTVLLAAAQANASASTVAVTSPDAGAAPAAYTQAQMAQVVALVNELKADLTQTVSDLNAAVTVINNMLATERTAKQRAT